MNYRKFRVIVFAMLLSATAFGALSAGADESPADAPKEQPKEALKTLKKNKPLEVLKYLNPIPEKNYVNKSQDRLIKKQAFKAGAVANEKPANNKEVGFFGVIPGDKLADSDFVESLLSNPRTNGISATIPWKQLEPGEEKYDWAVLDQLLKQCQSHNKSLVLRVSTCGIDLPDGDKPSSDTPEWVFAAGAKSVKYMDKDGKPHLMPLFWDQSYLAAFSNFISEMGSRYDKNPLLHSVGITGGGFLGGTSLVPTDLSDKGDKSATAESGFTSASQIENHLRKKEGLTQKQIVDHWKYVADLFPQAFPNTTLNFAINPPTPNRAGEDALDEISDYLVYRYGQHIYITRQDLKNGKHGFDDYRVLLKFRPDTYEGLALLPRFPATDLEKLTKTALDDGISFIELPLQLLTATEPVVVGALDKLNSHMGFQIVSQKLSMAEQVEQGEPLKVDFAFLNVGDAAPKRPVREIDKDVPTSYKVMVELKDQSGKPVAQLLHTPQKGTLDWKAGEPITWQHSLRMPALAPGEYEASVSLFDPLTSRKIILIDARSGDERKPTTAVPAGKVRIVGKGSLNKTTSVQTTN